VGFGGEGSGRRERGEGREKRREEKREREKGKEEKRREERRMDAGGHYVRMRASYRGVGDANWGGEGAEGWAVWMGMEREGEMEVG